MTRLWSVVRAGVRDFIDDDAMVLAAALAFYTALSLAPLLVTVIAIAALASEGAQDRILEQARALMGRDAGDALAGVVANAETAPRLGSVAGIASTVVLLIAASGTFAQLQYSLNRIWEVEPAPHAGLWAWLRKRLLSIGMVVTVGFLLLVSLVASAALAAASDTVRVGLPGSDALWYAAELAVSFALVVILFALIFKILPDAAIGWRDVWVGATATALLFVVGKALIALYLGRSSVASAYGAAGSLVVLLLWVYYAANILFFGAELTQAWAGASGRVPAPEPHARLRGAAAGLPAAAGGTALASSGGMHPEHTTATTRRTESGDERPISALIGDLTRQTGELLQKELQLTKLELAEKITALQAAVASFALAGTIAFAGLVILLVAAALALDLALGRPWLSFLLVGVGALVIAGVLAAMGKKSAPDHLAPERSLQSLQRDRELVSRHV